VHECIVVAASLSVSIEVLREYSTTNKNARNVCPPSLLPSLRLFMVLINTSVT
jgi:hypothetical protein